VTTNLEGKVAAQAVEQSSVAPPLAYRLLFVVLACVAVLFVVALALIAWMSSPTPLFGNSIQVVAMLSLLLPLGVAAAGAFFSITASRVEVASGGAKEQAASEATAQPEEQEPQHGGTPRQKSNKVVARATAELANNVVATALGLKNTKSVRIRRPPQTEGGVFDIMGEVPSNELKTLIGEVVKGSKGVTKVNNRLRVQPLSTTKESVTHEIHQNQEQPPAPDA